VAIQSLLLILEGLKHRLLARRKRLPSLFSREKLASWITKKRESSKNKRKGIIVKAKLMRSHS
jgi:hypothetical protein